MEDISIDGERNVRGRSVAYHFADAHSVIDLNRCLRIYNEYNTKPTISEKSRNSSVDIVKRVWDGRPKNWSSLLHRVKRRFCSPLSP
jgi:hypothetical protein